MTATPQEELVARLEKVTENLHGYLEDRAQEIARPMQEAAERHVEQAHAEARRQVQRATDLADELRRQAEAALQRAHRAEHQLGLRHTRGECGTCDTTPCQHCNTLHEHGPCAATRNPVWRPPFQQYRDLLHAIWLHTPWRPLTDKLTTTEKNLFADAVDNGGNPDERGPKADRWWECTEPGCHDPREDGYTACERHVSLAAMSEEP